MKHTHRKWAGWIGIIAIVLTQFALSAFACTMTLPVAQDMQADGIDCHAAGTQVLVNLCHEHCKDSKALASDTPASMPDFFPAFVVSLPEAMATSQLSRAACTSLEPANHSPPLSIVHCCFRI